MTKLIANVKLNCYSLCLVWVEVKQDMVDHLEILKQADLVSADYTVE